MKNLTEAEEAYLDRRRSETRESNYGRLLQIRCKPKLARFPREVEMLESLLDYTSRL